MLTFSSILMSQLKRGTLLPAPNTSFSCRAEPNHVQLASRQIERAGKEDMLKHHSVDYLPALHRAIQETCLKTISTQKGIAGLHVCPPTCATVQPSYGELLLSSKIQTFKNPDDQRCSDTWLSVMLCERESFPESSISCNASSPFLVSICKFNNTEKKSHRRVQFSLWWTKPSSD